MQASITARAAKAKATLRFRRRREPPCRKDEKAGDRTRWAARHRTPSTRRPQIAADALERPRFPDALAAASADAGVDQLGQRVDRLRRDGSRPGVERKSRHLVFRGHHALHDRHEALQIEQLIEGRGDIAGLEPVDRRRTQIDAADDDVARFLARFLQHLLHRAGDAAVLCADRLQVRMRADVGGEDRYAERRVAVDLLRDLEPVDLESGLLQRVGETLFGLAALRLAEYAIDHRLVAGFQALREHGVSCQRAARVEVDASVAETLGPELLL